MNCLLCGAADCKCGQPFTGEPVDIPAEAVKVAKGRIIRVDRGDGYRFRIGEREFDTFKRHNPRAFIVGAKPAVSPPALQASHALASMTRAELDAYAQEKHGLNTADLPNKGEVLKAIEAIEGGG